MKFQFSYTEWLALLQPSHTMSKQNVGARDEIRDYP